MAVRIVHKVNVKTDGLKRSNVFLRDELSKAGVQIGQHLQRSVRAKQRIDTGEERRRTLFRSRMSGATNLSVSVFNTVVQALVDETGARWVGSMPPSHPGSKLFGWVSRKGFVPRIGRAARRNIRAFASADARRAGADRAGRAAAAREAVGAAMSRREREIAGIAFLIARSIARRGLPRPGDVLRKPFETTRKEERRRVEAMVEGAIFRSVKRINGAVRK